MYSSIKQIQIIVSLLKQYDIRHIVISPGTRHVPLAHCCEIDNFFTCYSVVDERSAAFFALGLSEALNAPVAFTCTSATATCNYMPAMKEAYERNIPLLALTADRARYQRFHGENQCINQVDMYKPFCNLAVDTPDIQNDDDYWYCNRVVNEALMALEHHKKGPVQINFLEPLSIKRLSTFEVEDIPVTRKIHLVKGDIDWSEYKKLFASKKRVLVICGQHTKDSKLNTALNTLSQCSNVAITVDHFSNLEGERFIHVPLLSEVMNAEEYSSVKPDLIITYGSKIYSVLGVKYRNQNIEHWHIDPNGKVYDLIHSQAMIFECQPFCFFENITTDTIICEPYYKLWEKLYNRLDYSLSGYTNHYVIREAMKLLPPSSIVHASVLNSMRLSNFYNLPTNTAYYGNICADGIDGALSSFLAQADLTENIALLLIGDLSYLYDLNAVIKRIPKNVRILLVNNYAGAEFHYNISEKRISTLNKHIAAGHNKTIESTAQLGDFNYMCAHSEKELSQCLDVFFNESEKPILLECFTDANNDGENLRGFFAQNRVPTLRNRIGGIVKSVLGRRIYETLKSI